MGGHCAGPGSWYCLPGRNLIASRRYWSLCPGWSVAMREEPPQELVRLLERLDLAAPDRVRSMGRRMHRLARGLPLFDSVWVDALARARVITHFQAGEIAAGRGDALRVGPYVLWGRLPSPGSVDCYLA